MLTYIIKRVGSAVLTLLVVAVITFFLMNAVPGSPFMTEKSTPEQIARANAKYGLDKPVPVQFIKYLGNIFTESTHVGPVESGRDENGNNTFVLTAENINDNEDTIKDHLGKLVIPKLRKNKIVKAEIHVNNKTTVTASDIQFVKAFDVDPKTGARTEIPLGDLNLSVSNPDLVIATLNEGGSLDLQFELGRIIDSPMFDLGVSLKMQEGTPVTEMLFKQGKFWISCRLGICALIVAVIIGIPLGCLAAYNRGKFIDSVIRVLTTVGVAIPGFVVAALLLLVFCNKLGWFKTISGSLEDFKSYVLPVLALAFYPSCHIAKLTRTSMLDVINQDYIRTARAKGLRTKRIIFKHALRNSLIPVVTYLGPLTAYIITGGFVIEKTFQIPGLGKYFIESILNRDYPIIMGTTILLAALIVIMNLIVDIVYKLVDPRITLTKGDV